MAPLRGAGSTSAAALVWERCGVPGGGKAVARQGGRQCEFSIYLGYQKQRAASVVL